MVLLMTEFVLNLLESQTIDSPLHKPCRVP